MISSEERAVKKPANNAPTVKQEGNHKDHLSSETQQILDNARASLNGSQCETRPFELHEFDSPPSDPVVEYVDEPRQATTIDRDVDLRIELGRSRMPREQIMNFREGAVVRLDTVVSEAVDLYANEQLFARGEVVIIGDVFCVRITELIASTP